MGSYTYYCVVSDTEGDYQEQSATAALTVTKRELTASVAGENVPITKPYDGTTAVLADLSIELDSVVSGDEELVTAAAETYAYNSADVAAAESITAQNITLSGSKAGNYAPSETSASIVGAITPQLLDIGDRSFDYNGGNTFALEMNGVNGEKVTVPESGGTIEPNSDGTASIPGGSTMEQEGKGPVVVPEEGGVFDPNSGTVTRNIHTVSFDSQGGSAVASVEVRHGQKVAKPADPTRSGYTFDGWYTDAACTAAYNFSSGVTDDLILYAKWTEATDDASKTESDTPQTGDSTKLVLWAVLLGLSFIGIAAVLVLGARSKRNKRKPRG